MKYFLLAAVMLLMSCSKDSQKFGDNPELDIIGTWYIIGIDSAGKFTPMSPRDKRYLFNSDLTYEMYTGTGTVSGSYRIEDGNKFYRNGAVNPNLFYFEDNNLKIQNLVYDPTGTMWEVLEK